MKKSDLIAQLSEREQLSGKEAFDIVNLVFDGFTDALREGEGLRSGGSGASRSAIILPTWERTRRPASTSRSDRRSCPISR